MRTSRSSLECELRIPLAPLLVSLIMAGVGIVLLWCDALDDPAKETSLLIIALFLFVGPTLAGLLQNKRPRLSRWLVVVILCVVPHLLSQLLDSLEFLALVAIPAGIAVPLISLMAGGVIAVAQSFFVLVLYTGAAVTPNLPAIITALTVLWGMLGTMAASQSRVFQLSHWMEEYFHRAQTLLAEARSGKGELEQAIDNLAHANRQLALANERTASLRRVAEDARKAKTEFVANVSHEFRTPLNMIGGLVDLMVETPEIYDMVLTPKIRGDFEVLQRNCEHLSNMVDDVLDLTRVEAGRFALKKDRIDLTKVINEAIAAVRPLLEKKNLFLSVEIPEGLPQVYCDRIRIRQVILNLLSNAARFTETGGIKVGVACQDLHTRVSVTDTGPGIPTEDVERIFEPFWQGPEGPVRAQGGSGLGLSISREFVRLHGGRMWVESQVGVGTSFFFTLPISPPIDHVTSPAYRIREDWIWREGIVSSESAVPADELVRPRVLVFDTAGTLRHELTPYHGQAELVYARDMTEVRDQVNACPAHALLVNAPSLEELWSLMELATREIPETPFVGCMVPQPTKKVEKTGQGYLIKPVTRDDLAGVLERVGKPVKRVLLVDDDPDMLKLFVRMLHVCDNKLEIMTASDGKEALVKLNSRPPDLMLLDVLLPEMNGWEVLDRMGQDTTLPSVPTFLVSAQDPRDQPIESRCLLMSMDTGVPLNTLLRCSIEVSTLLLGLD